MALVIEFAGLPGSGKSTAVDNLIPLLAKAGYRVESGQEYRKRVFQRRGPVVEKLAFLTWLPSARRQAFLTVRYMWNSKALDVVGARWAALLLHRLMWIESASKADDIDVVIFDEGFCQGIGLSYSIEHDRTGIRFAGGECTWCAIDHSIVYFLTDPKTAGERVGERIGGRSRFDSLPRSEIATALGAVQGDLARVVSWFEQSSRFTTVDASRGEFEVANALAAWVIGMLAGGSVGVEGISNYS